MSNQPGTLYIVATPIGNREDITARAIRVLSEVDTVAAEDTRHSGKLLQYLGIKKPMLSVHDQNESARITRIIDQLHAGKSIALVSDAGTPLVSDPGFQVVRAVREAGYPVVPVPGPCAAIAALSVAGLPTDAFVFAGFAPAKSGGRRHFFEALASEPRTLIFYESPHRIVDSLEDMAAVFGNERQATIARELTKHFETIHADTLSELVNWVKQDSDQQRGEFVVLVHGQTEQKEANADIERTLKILLEELPLKQAVSLTVKLTGGKKNEVYDLALELNDESKGG
ncbi:MAG: 16S rRNA (cytidine(1402)-2'-O)-methyltransferase [Gammaproteobacteria bacterium]|nr:MAG: 16S rRNA (cytidine(1402)-2'-O)-methyltransferase [Gammaproteobacteria bacterium]